MLGRVVHRAEFERLLAAAAVSRSAHFALHHLPASTRVCAEGSQGTVGSTLSTGSDTNGSTPVDNLPVPQRFAVVVPKRHARRAVTRNALKRLGRQAMMRHADRLPAGLWLLRLRAGFALREFVSARSAALIDAVRSELEGLFGSASARLASPPGGPRSHRGPFDAARRAAAAP